MRLIDADTAAAFAENCGATFVAKRLRDSNAFPEVVTRCKDCKWFADNNDGEWYGCKMFQVVRVTPEDAPKPDDFCSYGEPKEG